MSPTCQHARFPEERDLPGPLALNNAHAAELSELDKAALRSMLAQAFRARIVGDGGAPDAFALAFDQSADYASPNFLWFRARHPRFVYLDRIAVAAAAWRRGLGRRSTPT